MAQDQFGNYICDISPFGVSPFPSSMFSGGGGETGFGDPNGVVDAPESELYVDQDYPYSIWVNTNPGVSPTIWFKKIE